MLPVHAHRVQHLVATLPRKATPVRQRILSSPMYAQVRQVILGEPVARWGLVLFAISLGLELATAANGRAFEPLSHGSSYLLLILALFALRYRLSHVDPRERPFWNDLTVVYLAWLGHAVLYAVDIPHSMHFYLTAELLLAGGYVAWLLVLERQPHRRQRLRPKVLERALAWPAAILFMVTLLTYFVLVPMVTQRSEYLLFKSSMVLYSTLDLYVFLRLLHLVQVTRSRHWKTIYSGLAVTAGSMLLADLCELVALSSPAWAGGLRPLYGLQWLSVVIVSCIRRHPLPVDEDEDPAAASLAAPALHTMISAVALPIIHFAGYRSGILDEATLPLRQWVIAGGVLLLGTFALLQHWLLLDRARHLWVDWARADKALRRSEQKARVVSERLRSKKSLQASVERFDIAFHSSPTPSAILSLTLGRFREVNAAFAQLVGYRKHLLIDRTPIDLDLWWDHRHAVLLRRRIRVQNRLEAFSTYLRSSQGERLDVCLSAEILELSSQPCLLIVAREGHDGAPTAQPPDLDLAAAAVYTVDGRDRILTWNDGAQELLGWQAKQAQHCYSQEILAPRGDIDGTSLLLEQRWRTQAGRRVSVQASVTKLRSLPQDPTIEGRLVIGVARGTGPRRGSRATLEGEPGGETRER